MVLLEHLWARAVGVRTESRDIAVGFCEERLAPFKVIPRILMLEEEFLLTAGASGTKIRPAELGRRAAELIGA